MVFGKVGTVLFQRQREALLMFLSYFTPCSPLYEVQYTDLGDIMIGNEVDYFHMGGVFFPKSYDWRPLSLAIKPA